MKIALLGDTHFGYKKHDEYFAERQRLFFSDVFFPTLKEMEIEHVVQLGDFFDSRVGLKHSTVSMLRDWFIPQTIGQEWITLVGNHDMEFRDSVHPNACTEWLERYDNFHVVDSPETITLGGLALDLIPWICKGNEKQIYDFVEESDSPIAIGHFELAGFLFYQSVKSHGVSPQFLHKYSSVYSGHYHTQSSDGKIHYIGTPYQMTLADANDPRGFWILDTEDRSMEFIENLHYNFIVLMDTEIADVDVRDLEGANVKVVRTVKPNKKIETWIESIAGVSKTLIVDDLSDAVVDAPEASLEAAKDIDQFAFDYIDSLDMSLEDKNSIKSEYRKLAEIS